jgi:hypothetical protein
VGIALPPAAFTVAVSKIVDGLAPGAADTAVVVAVADGVTLTSTEPDEFAKFPVET